MNIKYKVTLNQFLLLFLMGTLSPCIRLFPSVLSKNADRAAWISPIPAALGLIALVFVMYEIMKLNPTDLTVLFERVFGKIAGAIINTVYLLWITLLCALYLRYYAERLLATIVPGSSKEFLFIAILALVLIALRGQLSSLVRFNEFAFLPFMISLLLISALLFLDIKIDNFYPVTIRDAWPVISSSGVMLAIFGYFFFSFFFASKVNDFTKLRSKGVKLSALLYGISTVVIVASLGCLGASLSSRISLPFFVAVKDLSSLSPLNRLEPVIISLWIINDFVLISFLGFVAVRIYKHLLRLPAKRNFITPIIMLLFVLATYIARNLFELENFSERVAVPVNMALCYAMPIILLVVGKIRRIF